jgi:methylmalonyl-CoA/ethylmalonyl-CoA epimerase
MSSTTPFNGLDHFAIAVADTEAALKVWRDRFGFPVLYAEKVNNDTVLLTHLDLGNTHLQLVQPLTPNHPLHGWLAKNGGSGLHHFCLAVDDVDTGAQAATVRGVPAAPKPHQGTKGKRAIFLDRTASDGVQVELTGR